MTVALNALAADKGWVMLPGMALTQASANQDFGDGVHFAYQFLDGVSCTAWTCRYAVPS